MQCSVAVVLCSAAKYHNGAHRQMANRFGEQNKSTFGNKNKRKTTRWRISCCALGTQRIFSFIIIILLWTTSSNRYASDYWGLYAINLLCVQNAGALASKTNRYYLVGDISVWPQVHFGVQQPHMRGQLKRQQLNWLTEGKRVIKQSHEHTQTQSEGWTVGWEFCFSAVFFFYIYFPLSH